MEKHYSATLSEEGERKYLTEEELRLVVQRIDNLQDRQKATLLLFMIYTGCRISEALEITPGQLDLSQKTATIRCAKKRNKKIVYRQVPLPDAFVTKLKDVHAALLYDSKKTKTKLWDIHRVNVFRFAKKEVFEPLGLEGGKATLKSFRHTYVVLQLLEKTPTHLIKDAMGWVGEQMLTHYGNLTGGELRDMMLRIWK